MRTRVALLLGVLLFLGACAAPSLTARPRPARTKVESTAAPKAATPTPSSAPTATPQPEGPATLFAGTVRLDANYLIGHAGGNIIATGGGNIIATGGGNIIATGGGNIIATGGGNIIATGGGNIIATGGGNYRALETASVPMGTMLPVKGMAVVPFSLSTGKIIGQPAMTDDAGAFKVAIPDAVWADPAQKENIRLLATVPGKDEADPRLQDPRLQYNVLIAPSVTAGTEVDEDTAQLTAYMRHMLRSKFALIFHKPIVEAFERGEVVNPFREGDVSESALPLIQLFFGKVLAATRDAKVPESRYEALAHRSADLALAKLDLDRVKLIYDKRDTVSTEASMKEAMTAFLKEVRAWAATKTPEYFAQAPYLVEANASLAAGEKPYEILKPADLNEFCVRYYFAADELRYQKILAPLEDIFGSAEQAQAKHDMISAAGRGLVMEMMQQALKEIAASPDDWPLLRVIDEFGEDEG